MQGYFHVTPAPPNEARRSRWMDGPEPVLACEICGVTAARPRVKSAYAAAAVSESSAIIHLSPSHDAPKLPHGFEIGQHTPQSIHCITHTSKLDTGMDAAAAAVRRIAFLLLLLTMTLRGASAFTSTLSAISSRRLLPLRRRPVVVQSQGYQVLDVSDRPHPNAGPVVYLLDGTSMLYKVCGDFEREGGREKLRDAFSHSAPNHRRTTLK